VPGGLDRPGDCGGNTCFPGKFLKAPSWIRKPDLHFAFRIWGFGFRVSDFGFRISGFPFRISCFSAEVSILTSVHTNPRLAHLKPDSHTSFAGNIGFQMIYGKKTGHRQRLFWAILSKTGQTFDP